MAEQATRSVSGRGGRASHARVRVARDVRNGSRDVDTLGSGSKYAELLRVLFTKDVLVERVLDSEGKKRRRRGIMVLVPRNLARPAPAKRSSAKIFVGSRRPFVRSGKGKKDRMVPLTAREASALDLYLREGRTELVKSPGELALFRSNRGRRMSRSLFSVLLSKHAKAAGIEGAMFPHALRHAYATHLLKGKASIRHVQELLGHKSLEATSLYTRVSVDDLREVLSRCHPRERSTRKAVHFFRSR